MSNENTSNEENESFSAPKKRVDSSWKEEIRLEKEKARAAADGNAAADAAAPAGSGASAPGAAPKAAPAGEPSKIFLNFLAGLIQQALMQLGKIENPYGGGGEVDLEGARYTIELLAMLQEKTAGNLVEKEEQAITDSIRELKFHYIESAKAEEAKLNAQMNAAQPNQE